MDAILAALADPARWRLVTLLAERPRPVGVLADLAGARQPQTTKHLQALERAGLVASQRSGQRRIYALRPGPIRDAAAALTALADAAETAGAAFDRHGLAMGAERLAAAAPGWADGREFHFDRALDGAPDAVWHQLTDTARLAHWWTPDGLRIGDLAFDARPGGRIVLEYRDAEDRAGTGEVVGRAEGTVEAAVPRERLAYRQSPLLDGGDPAFTAEVEYTLTARGDGTDLHVRYRIADSTVQSADFIAGITTGFGQSLDKLTAAVAAETARTTDHPHPTRSTT
ncbi:metalloregulator ArsR/SmtB family transcription factor [Glycomyces endophyticus]|uniref:Metalloregulator ArsR/SmtB family transcription factor n=1 Tax=Glycomyces endophyticus TaxID=480996 RepID=A0ABN2HHI1_9ACTN